MNDIIEKIRSAYERDMALNQEAVTAADLPLSFESITNTWLSAVLCQNVTSARVVAHRLSPPDNGSSNRRKIYLDYNEQGVAARLPRAVFCKATQGLMNRLTLGACDGAHTEVHFYNAIRPLLPIEAPVSHHAHYNAETYNSIVMLTDLSDSVQTFCDHRTPMTLERARSQMRLLATVHGRCSSDPAVLPHLQTLPTWKNFFQTTLSFGMKEGATAGFLAAESVVPARLFQRHADIWPATVHAVDALDRLPRTLSHGDVHLKNWYVAGSGEMGLSDWQCATRGHWGRDLAYTLATALSVADRRAWERELIRYYLDQLAMNGGPVVDFDSAWKVYLQQLVAALAWWTVTLTPPPNMPDMQPRDVTLAFIERIATAMDDLDTLALAHA